MMNASDYIEEIIAHAHRLREASSDKKALIDALKDLAFTASVLAQELELENEAVDAQAK